MFCFRCGNEFDDGANFCPKCGLISSTGKIAIAKAKKVDTKPRVSRVGRPFSYIGFGMSLGALAVASLLFSVLQGYQNSHNAGDALTYAFLFIMLLIIAYALDGVSLAFSIIGLKKSNKKAFAIAGFVISIVAIVVGLLCIYFLPTTS